MVADRGQVKRHFSMQRNEARRLKKTRPDFDTPRKSYGRNTPKNFRNPPENCALGPTFGLFGTYFPHNSFKIGLKYAMFGVIFGQFEVARSAGTIFKVI